MTTWMIWLGDQLEEARLFKWELGELKLQGAFPLETIASTVSGEPVSVFFSTQHVSFIDTVLPKTTEKRLRLALGALVEDEIASPPENNFFALPQDYVPGQSTTLAVIHLSYLENMIQACQAAGLNMVSLAPDCFLLPLPTQGLVKFVDDNRVIVRSEAKKGLAIPSEHAALIMKELDSVPSIKPDLNESLPYNFLQAQFKLQAPKKSLGKLTWVYIALGGLFALHFLSLIIVGAVLSNRLDTIESQNLVLFDKVFPGAKKISSPKVLIERELQKHGGGSFDPIFNLLTDLSNALSKSSGAVLDTLDYTPGRLTAVLTLPDTNALDALNTALKNDNVNFEQEVNEQNNMLSVKLDILQGGDK